MSCLTSGYVVGLYSGVSCLTSGYVVGLFVIRSGSVLFDLGILGRIVCIQEWQCLV